MIKSNSEWSSNNLSCGSNQGQGHIVLLTSTNECSCHLYQFCLVMKLKQNMWCWKTIQKLQSHEKQNEKGRPADPQDVSTDLLASYCIVYVGDGVGMLMFLNMKRYRCLRSDMDDI